MKKQYFVPLAIHALSAESGAGIVPVILYNEKEKELVFPDQDPKNHPVCDADLFLQGQNDLSAGLYAIDSSLDLGSHALYIGIEYVKAFGSCEDSPIAKLFKQFTQNSSWGVYVLGDLASISELRDRVVTLLLIYAAQCNAYIDLAIKLDPNRLEAFSAAYIYAPNEEERVLVKQRAAEHRYLVNQLKDYYLEWMTVNSFERS